MIEEKLIAYLAAAQNVPVSMETPEQPPSKYIVVEKTGSAEANKLLQATIAIQTCAPTLYEAATMNEQIKELMRGFIWEKGIAMVEINSDYDFTDTKTKVRRYQAVFNIYYNKEV